MSGKLHFISAGAGSGKTHRLTQILHEKLSKGEIRASGVIATTFTRKAATELRERVRSHLLEQGAYKIANAMGQARINTVNGVCGDLLGRFAFEAGMSPDQQVLEEAQENILTAQAIDMVMSGEETAKLLGIVRRMGVEDWKKALSELINQTRANDIDIAALPEFAEKNAADLLAHFPKATRDDLTKTLLQAIEQVLPELESVAASGKKQNTNSYLRLVIDMRSSLLAGDVEWSKWAKLAGEKPEAGLKHIAETVSKIAGRYAEHPDLHRDIRDYLQAMFMLCGKALVAYADKKREMGVLDFTDQEHLLLKILDNETVAATLCEELDLLMVDEFQDTSPIQLALFLKLAQFAKEVYWVGDIKQAIYGFRGSDTTLMKAILDEVPAMGGDKEVLDQSWRSRKPLVDLVNEVFEPAFSSTLKAGEVRLEAVRSEPLNGPAFANWELNGSNADKRIAALGVAVRKLLGSQYQVHDKPARQIRTVRFGDIAILARSNDNVNKIAAELRAQGIPVAIEQPGLLATPEGILAVACLRRLNDPSDTIASAEILSLAGCEEPESWVPDRLKLMASAPEKKPSGYGNEWRETGDNAYPLLAGLAKLRAEMPVLSPVEALQTVIAYGQLSAIIMGWCGSENEARTRIANLEALLSLARAYEEMSRSTGQSASVSGLILWLNDLAEGGEDSLALPGIDAVKIMTHHRAKGLEWPVVILTGLESKVRDRLWSISTISQSAVEVRQPLKNRFIRYWPWPFGKMEKVTIAEPIAQSAIAKEFRAAAVEEEKRLLYVSMTRARDLLVFTQGGRDSEDSWLHTVAADWLQGEEDQDTLTLPSGGGVPYQSWTIDPPDDGAGQASDRQTIHWFSDTGGSISMGASGRLPLKYSPSSAAQVDSKVTETVQIGSRMALKAGVDTARLGTAIHGCIGAHLTDPAAPMTEAEIAVILQGMDVDGAVGPQELLGQIHAFIDWFKSRWPDAVPYAEIPTELWMPNGQVLQGRIDCLLKVQGGWILIDHKSSPGGSDRWDAMAQEYAGQLTAYKDAIEKASGVPVLENWLFLPVAGAAIRIE